MRARRAVPAILTLSICLLLCACGAQDHRAEIDRQFASILEMEDLRTTHEGALLELIQDDWPVEIRVRALLALGRIGAPVVEARSLENSLRTGPPEVRRMSAFAMGETDDPEAQAFLVGALSDEDAEVRLLAAEAIGKLGLPESVPPLLGLLDDPSEQVATMALHALWKPDAPGHLPDLAARAGRICAQGSVPMRRAAAYCLMRSLIRNPDEASLRAAILPAARDDDALVRSFAARGIGAARAPAPEGTLARLAADGDWRVRVNAYNALQAHPAGSWEVYQAGLEDELDSVRLSALASLEGCPLPDAGPALRAALPDPRTRFREVALLALARRDGESALADVEPLAEDPAWSLRARSAEALAAIGSPPALGQLLELLSDPDPRVRSAAVASAAELSLGDEGKWLDTALGDEDLYVRAAALAAVGQREEAGSARPEAITMLVAGYRKALADAPNDARLAALDSLARLGGVAARDELDRALMEDPDYLVRRRAADLLEDHYDLDRHLHVGHPPASRDAAGYLEAVRRARRRVTAVFETGMGRIEAELYPADAPLTVDNFLRLARDGFYDGTVFHRVVPNFVIQDGDPRGDGNGGPGWQIRCEINRQRYRTGALGMALSGKDTGGSQYFMTQSPQPHLDGGYTVFGQVIGGQDVVDRMLQGTVIHRITIKEEPGA